MIEIHAWITLRYSDYDSEDHLQRDFIANFKGYLAQQYNWVLENSYGRFIDRNGLECFAIDVQHNHKDSFYVLDIFSWVAKESTGSYGLLYFHDDEDQEAFNEFQVYVLKRGKLAKSKDSFLSPYHEEVERKREYDENNPPED
ncbi:Imm7 family immunity protein [Hymenobacter terrenus]|uniref:Imm7 family immunity protein n=1 Tax=Hymenobacter terrenus TaxID=1629124 RepID=UPI00069711D6|nr:Imm7 family immunity protein [Hymenobacter terrenus]